MKEQIENARRRPRRTMLYVSADIVKHTEKAPDLPADSIIYDLQESISPEFKERGRERLRECILHSRFRGQERIVRVNPVDSPWIEGDLTAAAGLPIDAVLFTGITSAAQIKRGEQMLDEAGGAHLPIMTMVESPLAVLNAEQIASASYRLTCLVVSNANLMTSMYMPYSPERTGLFTSLTWIVLAARTHGLSVVDGAHLDIKDPHACEYACRQSRDFGFDGKAVIHPVQLAYTNDAFTPNPKFMERRREIIRLMEEANKDGRSYAMLDSRLLQPSELEAARHWVHLDEAIQERIKAFEDAG